MVLHDKESPNLSDLQQMLISCLHDRWTAVQQQGDCGSALFLEFAGFKFEPSHYLGHAVLVPGLTEPHSQI